MYKMKALGVLLFCALLVVCLAETPNDAAIELLQYAIRNARHLPRPTSIPRSEKFPEIGLTSETLIQLYGYPSDTHQVTTEDGYILTLNRIPGPGPVVFLMHGLLANSACYLFNGVDSSLGFVLAKHGYDVWLGNARGSSYSRKHNYLDPDSDKSSYWNFTWNEIGLYDLPVMIDYVLSETGQESLIYIGHSQGTTSFFVMASELPEYNRKVKLSVSLAPVVFMSDIPNAFLKEVAKNIGLLEVITDAIDFYEILPQWQIYSLLAEDACSDGSPTQKICIAILSLIGGENEKQMNTTRLPVYFSYFPAGASVKQMYHYGQEINSGHFRKYDYGIIENLGKYGTFTPPDYDVKNVVAPVALYYSKNDRLSSATDVEGLAEQLPNVVEKHLMEDEKWAHFDYLSALQVNELLYNRLLNLLQNY